MRICPWCRTVGQQLVCPLDGCKTVPAAGHLDPDNDPLIGTRFADRYEIEAFLGRGGFGTVYRASQDGIGRKVALKVLRAELAGNLDEIARFQQEARAIAALRHPNIVTLYDFGHSESGNLYLAMELAEGEPLTRLMAREGPLPAARVLHLGLQILDALAEAHAAGIVHRDLTPNNLVIVQERRRTDVVKVLDFGIAKVSGALAPTMALTRSGIAVGSPRYMSPEQCRAGPVTPQSDLYSFGCIMFEALCGFPAFERASPTDYLIAHVQDAPAVPMVRDQPLSGPMAGLILQCLSKQPSARPASAEAARSALELCRDAPLSSTQLDGRERPVDKARVSTADVPTVRGPLADPSAESGPPPTHTDPEPEPPLELHLIGEMRLERAGVRVRLPPSRKARALLAYLVLTDTSHRRARLCDLLWDVADDPRAALRWCLSKLRSIVDEPEQRRIVANRESVRFERRGMRVDMDSLSVVLREGAETLPTPQLQRLVREHSGQLLEGLELDDFLAFRAWCAGVRDHARRAQSAILRELVRRSGGDAGLTYARQLVELEPWDEGARVTLVDVLNRLGRREEAVQERHRAQRELRSLGLTPDLSLWRRAQIAPAPSQEPRRRGPMSLSTTPEVGGADGEERLVGRESERQWLASKADAAFAGGTIRVLLISGEPGVGKSRLARDFVGQLNQRATVLGRAYEAESGRPLGIWLDALRGHAEAEGLAELFRPSPDPAPRRSRQKLHASVAAYLARWRGDEPLVVLFDDLQWFDVASAELLHSTTRQLSRAGGAGLFILTARDGELVDNTAASRVLRGLRDAQVLSQLNLGPLSAAETAALLRDLGGPATAPAIHEWSGGNPFYALELARAGWTPESGVPTSVASVVRDRLARLSDEARDVLRWATIVGRSVEVEMLASLSMVSDHELMSSLELLERHSLLVPEGTAYRVAHDLVWEVARASISAPRRRLMHGRVAQLLHDRESEAPTEASASAIAHHASRAGNAALASTACLEAARRALQLFANQTALKLAQAGMTHAQTLSEPKRTRVLIELWQARLGAEAPRGEDRSWEELETLALAASAQGQLQHARLAFHLLSNLRWRVGVPTDAYRFVLNAERLTRGLEGAARIDALAEAGRCLLKLERELPQAEGLVLEASAHAERLGLRRASVLDAKALLREFKGDYDGAERDYGDAALLARNEQDRLREFLCREHLVVLRLRLERYEGAYAECRTLVALGARLRESSEGAVSHALSSVAGYGAGVIGRKAVDEKLAVLRDVDAKQRLGVCLLGIALIELQRGRAADAGTAAREARELARQLKLRSSELFASAVCLEASGGADDATRSLLAVAEGEIVSAMAGSRRAAALEGSSVGSVAELVGGR